MEAQYYCRSVPGFSVIRALSDVGSRVNKHWFLVHVDSERDEQLMMTSPRSANCVLPLEPQTRATLKTLLAALKHPFLYPVTDIDFIREKQVGLLLHSCRVESVPVVGHLAHPPPPPRLAPSWPR